MTTSNNLVVIRFLNDTCVMDKNYQCSPDTILTLFNQWKQVTPQAKIITNDMLFNYLKVFFKFNNDMFYGFRLKSTDEAKQELVNYTI